MSELTPQQAVEVLTRADWSEARIARAIGTSQPTVHRIKHGHEGAAYRTVIRLLELAREHGNARDSGSGATHVAG